MSLDEQADLVSTREEFERFLEAWSAWVTAMPNLYRNLGNRLPDQPDWSLLANMVMAARVYE